MMGSIFSGFDPLCLTLPLNWLVLFLGGLIVNHKSALSSCAGAPHFGPLWRDLLTVVVSPFVLVTVVLVFVTVLFSNFLGMGPYLFTLGSHVSVSLTMAIVLWVTVVVKQMTENPKKFVKHLTPHGAPLNLASFLSGVESVSILIRPLTLGVRLMANLTAGHILLALAGAPMASTPLTGLFSSLPLVVLELAVAGIQAYVFSVLVCLYHEEVYKKA